jgi:hypothetical protein
LIFLYVLLGIVAFFAFLLSLKANVRLEFTDELILSISVLGIKFKILPGKEKPINTKDYSYDNHQKRLRKKYEAQLEKIKKKEKKKAAKEKKKAERKSETKEQKRARKAVPKRSISDWVNIAVGILAIFFKKFTKHLRIKVARLKVNVATGDAASTAILYGAVIQSVAYLIEILSKITNVDGLEKADIDVKADYISEKTTLDLCFVFSMRVWHLFDILFGVIGRAIKRFISTSPEKKNAELSPPPAGQRCRRKRKKKTRRSKPPAPSGESQTKTN